jgi:hypothetical protein
LSLPPQGYSHFCFPFSSRLFVFGRQLLFFYNVFLFPLTTNHIRSRSHPHPTSCFGSH